LVFQSPSGELHQQRRRGRQRCRREVCAIATSGRATTTACHPWCLRRPDRDVHRKVQHVPAPLWICEWGRRRGASARRRGGGGLKKATVGLGRRGVPQIGEDVRGMDHSGVTICCPSGGVHPAARCGIDPERRNSGGRRHPHEAMRRRRQRCGPNDVREAR
jgi:hypothetical protein